MSAGSVVGFGAVFVLVCMASAVVGVVVLRLVRPCSPAVDRILALLVAAAPVVLGLTVVGVLAVGSLMGPDHCDVHGHHAHLCLVHGAPWLDRLWALAVVATMTAVVAARAGELVITLVRGRRLVARLERAVPDAQDIAIVPSTRPFCFVAGIARPRIYASTAARGALAPAEWTAMLAHERGHVTHHDLRWRLALELCLLVAPPGLAAWVRDRWELATERLRDADAAAVTGSDAVAGALVQMARAVMVPGLTAAFRAPVSTALAARVNALLDREPRGEGRARVIRNVALAALVVSIVGLAATAGHVHHTLETLLG